MPVRREQTKNMVLCALFVALIVIGAFLRIPIPIVPMTLQLEFVLLAGLLLGGKWGLTAVLLYIAMGLLGLPVFAQGGGVSYVLKPSFGYIVGFAFAAYATGTIAQKSKTPSFARLLTASLIGVAIVYAFGVVYLYVISRFYLGKTTSAWQVFLSGFLLLVPGDIVLSVLGAFLAKRLLPILRPEAR